MTRYRRPHHTPRRDPSNDRDLIVKIDNRDSLILEAVRTGGMATVEMRECFGAWHLQKGTVLPGEQRRGTLLPASQFPPLRNSKLDKGRTCLECRTKNRESVMRNKLRVGKTPRPEPNGKVELEADKMIERIIVESVIPEEARLPQWKVTILRTVTIQQEETRTVEAKDFLDATVEASTQGEVIKVERIRA